MVLGGTRWPAGLKGLAGVHEILDLDLWQTGRSKAERARWSTWTTLDYEQRRLAHQPPYGDYPIVLKRANQLVDLVGLAPSMMPFALRSARSPGRLGELL
jgi:hypothetical protein